MDGWMDVYKTEAAKVTILIYKIVFVRFNG